MVLASNGGAVAAGLAALENGVAGSLSSGLHHARCGSGAGFCTFNGLVIAAREALAAGAGSVLILDLDAHCGGGTASLIAGEPRIWQIDVSVSGYDSYSSSNRIRLDIVGKSRDYLPTVRRRLDEADCQGLHFDLCLYNAGMDPFENCPTGGKHGITRVVLSDRERMVQGSEAADRIRVGRWVCWTPSGRGWAGRPPSLDAIVCGGSRPNLSWLFQPPRMMKSIFTVNMSIRHPPSELYPLPHTKFLCQVPGSSPDNSALSLTHYPSVHHHERKDQVSNRDKQSREKRGL
jgi:hypothetical protein